MIERKVNSETVLSWETMEAQQQDMQRCIAAMPGFVGTAVSSVFQIGEAASMLSPKFKKIWDTLKSEITGPAEEAVPHRRRRRRNHRRGNNRYFKVVNPTEESVPAEEVATAKESASEDKIVLADTDQAKVELAEEIARTLSRYKFFIYEELKVSMSKVDSKLTRQELENILRSQIDATVERFAYRLATMPPTREEQMAYLKK